jgi:N-acetylglucosamine-6-phosphate deacetylase
MDVIDLHTHGIAGRDTRCGHVEDVLAIAGAHGISGVAGVVLSLYPAAIPVMRRQLTLVREAMKVQGARCKAQGDPGRLKAAEPATRNPQPATAFASPDAARILGAHLEGPFLNPSRAGALDADAFLRPSDAAFSELIEGFEDIVRVMTVAPELPGALPLIGKASEAGIVVAMGHSDATYTEAQAGFKAGARSVTHLFNAMRGFHHREPGLAGFGLLDDEVYVEVVADPYHLDMKTLDLLFRVKDPERIIIVSDSVRETKMGADDAARNASSRLLGGSVTVLEAAERLVGLGFPEGTVKAAITTNPARCLGLVSPL